VNAGRTAFVLITYIAAVSVTLILVLIAVLAV